MSRPSVWIFCRVVDNYGDAGVSWRLARQLAAEHGFEVSLFVDRFEVLEAIEPRARGALADGAAEARVGGVRVGRWPAPAARTGAAASDTGCTGPAANPAPAPTAAEPLPDVAISAFGCELPAGLRAALAGGPRRPLWINLEYLSAEGWVAGCHRLASVKPADLAVEHFFYPGFGPDTGGLLRERDLDARRRAFVGSAAQRDWLAALGLARPQGTRLLSLFCYRTAPVGALLALLAAQAAPTLLAVPPGVGDDAIEALAGRPLAPGEGWSGARLSIRRIAFLAQDDYDRLLWSADLNFVRGEDSWIRAHWAARPFVWQPYVQHDDAHHAKLRAFLERLRAGIGEPDAADAIDAAMLAWSGEGDLGQAWERFSAGLPALAPAYERWAASLAGQPDLATRLAEFMRATL